MKRTLWPALVALAVLTCAGSSATATSRIKDLANIEGIRQNQLIGYGLVVGLNGTGGTLNNNVQLWRRGTRIANWGFDVLHHL